jgi:hypothetical protein
LSGDNAEEEKKNESQRLVLGFLQMVEKIKNFSISKLR